LRQAADIEKWVLIDAKGTNLGRLISLIAVRLRDSTSPFTPHLGDGDNIIVINAEKWF
jgi:ribosomal protein L13